MAVYARLAVIGATLALLAAGCAPPRPPGPLAEADSELSRSATPKRVTAVVRGDPFSLAPGAGGPVPGKGELKDLVNVGLTVFGTGGILLPRLAEAVPSTENGLWRILPDGTMETSWKLRPNIRWHDGTPFTAADAVFGTQLEQDERLPFSRHVGFRYVAGVDAPDPSTVVVKWKQVYIDADQMFVGEKFGWPMPRHLLEASYSSGDPDRFAALPYWNDEFVGTGPFRVQQWERGSHVILVANDGYLQGRPKVDSIEVRFLPDPSAIAAHILAGAVDVTFGGRLALEWAQQITRQTDKMIFGTSVANPIVVTPNLVNPTPGLLSQPDFRRALIHALDRQQMVETLTEGRTWVADQTVLNPQRADFREVESAVVKYPHDARRVAQLLEGMGLRRAADGLYRDHEGQRVGPEIRTTQGDVQQEKSMFATADFWTQAGIGSETVLIPAARRDDREYRANRPAFELKRTSQSVDDFHSSQLPSPTTSWRGNNPGGLDPRLDGLIDRLSMTIPPRDRVPILREIVQYLTDQVAVIGLFYDVEITMTSTRIKNVATRGDQTNEAWNAHEWDVAS